VNFTVKYHPYQLYPEASKEGEDKYEWYKIGGTVANTMDAHRVIQHFQEEKGPETADKIINCMVLRCHARNED
jgi:predicted DsbA family dithiol-disulfide isomerase